MQTKNDYRHIPSYRKLRDRLWKSSPLRSRSEELSIMSIDRYYGPRSVQSLRTHDFWEMGCVVRGSVEFVYEKDKALQLKSDSVFIIPPQIPHGEICDQPADIIWLSFYGSRLSREIMRFPETVKNHELACLIENLWIFTEIEEDGIGQELDAKALEIIARFFRILQFSSQPEASDMVERSIAYMHSHMAEHIAIPDLAAHMGCSQTYFRRLFKRRTGRTPRGYLQELRMRHAVSLLEHTKMMIEEISRAVGYDDPFYFSRAFRKSYSISPRQYRCLVSFK